MKRKVSLLLALAIIISCIPSLTFPTYATESAMTMSDEGMQILKAEEGFSKYPYWDYKQYTVGYGTCCPSDMVEHYKTYGISREEAETLLRNYMSSMEYTLNRYIDKYGLSLTQNQYDAIALFSYNVGTGWTKEGSGSMFNAITYGAAGNDLIRAFGSWCKANGEIKDYLLRRRMSEANMYLNGVYSKDPPETYGYIIYNPNGGTVCHSTQVFDSSIPAVPVCDATRPGCVFMGWYTAGTGGQKVTELNASVQGITLYAQWLRTSEMENYTDTVDVNIKVTGSDVNFRTGPGTDHDIFAQAQVGEILLITETVLADELLWGRSEKGWIALKFTNFDEVYASLPIEPPTEAHFPQSLCRCFLRC